jgi:hypothetical protein
LWSLTAGVGVEVDPGPVADGLAAPPVLANAPTAKIPAQRSAPSRVRRIVVNLVRIVIEAPTG